MTEPPAARPSPGAAVRGAVLQLHLLPAESPAELVARACPDSPVEIVTVLHHALGLALRWKVDGSAHIRSCLASGVNAIPVACSDKCLSVQISMAWAEQWLASHPSTDARRGRRATG